MLSTLVDPTVWIGMQPERKRVGIPSVIATLNVNMYEILKASLRLEN